MPGTNDKILQVAWEVAASFVKNYKCPLPEATDFFYSSIIKNPAVSKLIETAATDKQLAKNAAFKNFIKQHKKELYYRLRQYKGTAESKAGLVASLDSAMSDPSDTTRESLLGELASFHVSSQERFEQNQLFYEQLAGVMDDVHTIVDIGCGVQPLFFPHDRFLSVKKYMALDKDKDSVHLMEKFVQVFPQQYAWLLPRLWNIGEGWKGLCTESGVNDFDLALILKVVPVVRRTSPALMDQLASVPAKTIIISGVKESMVKKQDIERKERRAIDSFIKDTGRMKEGEFELDNEFFIIAR